MASKGIHAMNECYSIGVSRSGGASGDTHCVTLLYMSAAKLRAVHGGAALRCAAASESARRRLKVKLTVQLTVRLTVHTFQRHLIDGVVEAAHKQRLLGNCRVTTCPFVARCRCTRRRQLGGA